MKLVSACLIGMKTRYDGKVKPNEKVLEMFKKGELIPICPEQLGGLSTPREPAEQKDNKVFTKSGLNITDKFERGAQEVLQVAKLLNIKEAILKSKSPSCGCGKIYDGTFTGKLIAGDGVTAKLLKENGIKIITEEEI